MLSSTKLLQYRYFSAVKTIAVKGSVQIRHESTKTFMSYNLTHRGLVRVKGKDASSFLQGLITNDMGCLDTKCDINSIFSMLLNLQGRILYDMIIYKTPENDENINNYLLECDKDVVEELIGTIKRYKVRKKVDISDASDELNVWAICPDVLSETPIKLEPEVQYEKKTCVASSCADPRVKCFGYRMILQPNITGSEVITNSEDVTKLDRYHARRYRFGIGEGIIDMPPGNSLPLECNAAFMNGVSFDKGCYIGQELTARTHHTGVIRKRLMPVQFHGNSDNCHPGFTVENSNGKNCGKMRGLLEQDGLALLRVGEVLNSELKVKDGSSNEIVGHLNTWVPHWWPRDTDAIIKKALQKLTTEGHDE